MGNIGVMVLPEQHAISQANGAFEEHGSLINVNLQKKILGLGS